MLASLACSIYIIYLYRKLKATKGSPATDGGNVGAAVKAEIATLNEKLDALEARLSSGRTR
jgi:hypothetical protein